MSDDPTIPSPYNIARTVFSEDGKYRYTLYRDCGMLGTNNVLFIMANPSIADKHKNDPTTKRALEFAHKLDCKAYLAVNCFAMIATDSSELKPDPDPVGPENDAYIQAAAEWADKIVIAWGTIGALHNRGKEVLRLLNGYELLCLGYTKEKYPNFPLYLPARTVLIPYEPSGSIS